MHIHIYIYVSQTLRLFFSERLEVAPCPMSARKLEVKKTSLLGKDLFHDHWSVTGVRRGGAHPQEDVPLGSRASTSASRSRIFSGLRCLQTCFSSGEAVLGRKGCALFAPFFADVGTKPHWLTAWYPHPHAVLQCEGRPSVLLPPPSQWKGTIETTR